MGCSGCPPPSLPLTLRVARKPTGAPGGSGVSPPPASRGGAPHLRVEMLHELLPRDAPKPGHRKALLRHAGLGLVCTGPGNRDVSVTAGSSRQHTTPEEKGREGGRTPEGRLARSAGRGGRGRLPGRRVAQARWADPPEVAAAGGRGSASPAPPRWFPSGLLSLPHSYAEVKGHQHGAGRPSSASAPAFSAAARPGHPTPDFGCHRGEAVAG